MSAPRQAWHGACHCGKVRFELDAGLARVFECSCSLCRRRGALWHGAAEQDLRVVAGEDQLSLYQFGTGTAKHYFCRHCGVAPFARPRLNPGAWVVNVRCIDALDLSALTVGKFDGAHWERAAQALLAMQAARA